MGVIFLTVVIDLIGFGMIIPLVGLYGKHFGAQGVELALLGASFSIMQFLFAPFWGSLSDRLGRRPIILVSLAGSTLSYIGFALAPGFWWLLISRSFAGLFAANISAAQAYVADITTPEKRAQGMGMIGAAFGIGFTLGPPLGGIASAHWGLSAPGWIAAAICGVNFLAALVRLPESLKPELRLQAKARPLSPLPWSRISQSFKHPELGFLLAAFFGVTFAFSNMEQTLSLLLQSKFGFETGVAGYKTGMLLLASGIVGALIQGGMIRKLAPRFGEMRLLVAGLVFNFVAMVSLPWGPTYTSYFLICMPLAIGSALINPSISALISKSASNQEQGSTLGVSQSLGSLARALGPFCGLLTFEISFWLPYAIAAVIAGLIFSASLSHLARSSK